MENAGPDLEGLVYGARAGDDSALGQLLELFRSYLTILARLQIGRRLQGKVDAADLVQETFLQAYRCFSQFRGTREVEFAVWLRQILASRVAKLVRRYHGTECRDVRLEHELEHELDQSSRRFEVALVAPLSSPSHKASRREQAVLLAQALARLAADDREVIILRHLEERTFPDVAERMGRSVDAVKKLWVRALAKLRQALEATSWIAP
jgi:RNA polymerase sigma-70 factor (ECF subfamily)